MSNQCVRVWPFMAPLTEWEVFQVDIYRNGYQIAVKHTTKNDCLPPGLIFLNTVADYLTGNEKFLRLVKNGFQSEKPYCFKT